MNSLLRNLSNVLKLISSVSVLVALASVLAVLAAVVGAGAMSTVTATGASLFAEASSFEEGGAQLSLMMTAMWKTPMLRTTMTSPCHPYCSLQ